MIPKFRAWDKKRKRIVEVVAINFYLEQVVTKDITIPFDYVELMQSTGLKDRNGVEIFEGDIMSLKYPRDRRYKVVAKVINGQEISAMILKFDNDFTTEEFPLYKISAENNLEVIGNIYENPELLGDTDA